MKKLKRLLSTGIIFALVLVMGFSLVACNKDKGNDPPPPPPTPVVVTIGDAASTIAAGETITFTATVTGTDNTAVTWSVSDPATLMVTEEGVVSVLVAPELLDKNVVVTATSVADPTAKATKSVRVKAATVAGRVGRLTSEAIAEAGNASISATGTVTDIYRDHYDSSRNRTNVYDSVVTMESGKWSGGWRMHDSEEGYMTNAYRQGTEAIRYAEYDYNGFFVGYTTGSETLEDYINKDNEVASKRLTDNMSAPLAWETQHLWNHIGNLNVNKFTYDPDHDDTYTFELGDKSTDAENYLMAYLVVSLTPMLGGEDSLRSVSLILDENDKIVKIMGQSNIVYTGASYNQQGTLVDYDAMSYTQVELDLTDIGTAKVESVKPYEAVANADKLAAALEKMQDATSYAYTVTDVTTSAPEVDDGDYTIESVSRSSMEMGSRNAPVNCTIVPRDRNSATGTVGTRGWVTPEAILVERTTKYTASLDDKVYRLAYTGYRQFDGYYDEFAYDSTIKDPETDETVGGLRGVKRVDGNMMDNMPQFDFSTNLFTCAEGMEGGKQVYVYTLRETAITRDIARQIAVYNADSAQAGSGSALTITVDANGNLIKARYPYSITLGTYVGYCTIAFSGIGETTIQMENITTNYVERGVRNTWDQYTTKYYEDLEGNRDDNKNAQAAIDDIYGANKTDIPQAEKILAIFGDNFSGPFYDDRTMTNPDGSTYKRRNISLTLRSVVLDDNGQVANFDELIAECDRVFGEMGFVKDLAQTDLSGGDSGRGSRYVVYTTSKITIVLENNFTKNFWMYFYNAGEYNRSPQED